MKEKRKTSTGKTAALSIASFFMALTLIFMSVIVVAEFTMFNDRDILAKVSGTTYFSQLNEDITFKCKTIAAKYGVKYEAISAVITPGKIDTDMTVYFNSVKVKDSVAAEKTINTETLEKELISSFESNDVFITDSQKASVKTVAALVAREYKDAIVIENLQNFMYFVQGYRSVINYVFLGFFALFIYLFFVILTLNGKEQKHRLLRRYAVCCGSAGLTVISISLIIRFTEIIQRISFTESEREYNLFVDMFSDFIRLFSISGGCFLMLAIVLCALWFLSVTGRARRLF